MPVGTVRMVGLRETRRAFRRMSGGLDVAMRAALREAAWPVARAARAREHWDGASVGTIGPIVRARGVAVTQRKRKVTGLRPDYGALQMTEAFIPALEENAGAVELAAEGAIDTIERLGGF